MTALSLRIFGNIGELFHHFVDRAYLKQAHVRHVACREARVTSSLFRTNVREYVSPFVATAW